MCRARQFLQEIFVASKREVSLTLSRRRGESHRWPTPIHTALGSEPKPDLYRHRLENSAQSEIIVLVRDCSMFFLSAAKCDFGFVTVFVTQEHCINLNFVWDRSYVSINERKVFFSLFSISCPFHLFIVSSFSTKHLFSVHWHINKRHFFFSLLIKEKPCQKEMHGLIDGILKTRAT